MRLQSSHFPLTQVLAEHSGGVGGVWDVIIHVIAAPPGRIVGANVRARARDNIVHAAIGAIARAQLHDVVVPVQVHIHARPLEGLRHVQPGPQVLLPHGLPVLPPGVDAMVPRNHHRVALLRGGNELRFEPSQLRGLIRLQDLLVENGAGGAGRAVGVAIRTRSGAVSVHQGASVNGYKLHAVLAAAGTNGEGGQRVVKGGGLPAGVKAIGKGVGGGGGAGAPVDLGGQVTTIVCGQSGSVRRGRA